MAGSRTVKSAPPLLVICAVTLWLVNVALIAALLLLIVCAMLGGSVGGWV